LQGARVEGACVCQELYFAQLQFYSYSVNSGRNPWTEVTGWTCCRIGFLRDDRQGQPVDGRRAGRAHRGYLDPYRTARGITLSNDAALVTGAGSGMGQAAAWRLAAAGRKVAVLDLNTTGMAATAERYPDRITTHEVDVSDADAVAKTIAAVEGELGPIGRVVNAAGIVRVRPLLDQDIAEIALTMAVNYGGVVNVCQAVVPGMVERGRGEVVNFASLMGWVPQARIGAYVASKFAVVGYTEVLWQENRAHGVRFACVCPPTVRTPMLDDFMPNKANHRKSMPITADKVIDEIDRCLERDRLLVLPGAAKAVYSLRRHTPRLLRKVMSNPRFDLLGTHN
jgi:short-subunit dehydrogenase